MSFFQALHGREQGRQRGQQTKTMPNEAFGDN